MKKNKTKMVKKSKPTKRGKKGMGAFAGGLIGAALGVGAALLSESKLGKKLGKDAKHLSADFYRFMIPQVKKIKEMGEAEYKKFVAEAMKRYGKDKKISRAEAQRLVKGANGAWKHLKKSL